MSEVDDLAAFCMARLAENEPKPGEVQDYTSWQHLAATWSDHPDYRAEWKAGTS